MNRRDDVLAIQKLLNAHVPKYASPLRVDGLYGLRTYEAIRKIHQSLVRMAYPDGRIDPQGPTLRLLNNAKLSGGAPMVAAFSRTNSQPSNSVASVPADVVQAAQAAQEKWNVPVSITIAQWILESGSGKRKPSHSNNPFWNKSRPWRAVCHGFDS